MRPVNSRPPLPQASPLKSRGASIFRSRPKWWLIPIMLGLTGFVLYHSHRVTARRRGHVSGAFGGQVVKQSDDSIPAEIRSPELNVPVRSAALN